MTQCSFKIGLTPDTRCSYLPNQVERLGVAISTEIHSQQGYQALLQLGFRRSGDTLYKPMCETCNACQSLRINAEQFSPSKSQNRLLNKLSTLTWELKTTMDSDWFDLYERYITARHSNGSMFPANKQQFFEFSQSTWLHNHFLHIYDIDSKNSANKQLIAIAITDVLPDSLSAMYTFFEPNHKLSMGSLSVLLQLKLCQKMNKKWLYPGYQIDDCPAMNYKDRYKPNQKLVNMVWQG